MKKINYIGKLKLIDRFFILKGVNAMVYVVDFSQIKNNDLNKNDDLKLVGGKALNLGYLYNNSFNVPLGFVVTTHGFKKFIQKSMEFSLLTEQLSNAKDSKQIVQIAALIRENLDKIYMPEEIIESVTNKLKQYGEENAYAIRSSATAEDLPNASFAGQQETFINIIGVNNVINAIKKCFISLYTDRACIYRNAQGFKDAELAVIIQKMVFPQKSGILFTADPITGHRMTVSIEAGFGLGEALVSGITKADLFKVRNKKIIEKKISSKEKSIMPLERGGTEVVEISSSEKMIPSLTDEEVLELSEISKKIENMFKSPQDIEWAVKDENIYILQSRPITSLYPCPSSNLKDDKVHLYCSFGHMQMMLSSMPKMSNSIWMTLIPFLKQKPKDKSAIFAEGGANMFFDFTSMMYNKTIRKYFVNQMKTMDEKMGDAMEKFFKTEEYLKDKARSSKGFYPVFKAFKPVLPYYLRGTPILIHTIYFKNPELIIDEVFKFMKEFLKKEEKKFNELKGSKRIHEIRVSIGNSIFSIFKTMINVPISFFILPSIQKQVYKILKEELNESLLSRSVHGNVTSEMGLKIGDLADKVRGNDALIDYLQSAKDEDFYEKLKSIPDSCAFLKELNEFMEEYGARAPGEIDISNPRYEDKPSMLMPSILSHLNSNKYQEHRLRNHEGEKEARDYIDDLINRIKRTPFGNLHAKSIKKQIQLFRNTVGLREFPKYLIIRLTFLCRKFILEESKELCHKGILDDIYDVFFLDIEELEILIDNNGAFDAKQLIKRRKEEFRRFKDIPPPRVITSNGEIIEGEIHRENIPKDALIGTAVSAGVVEGIVSIVMHPKDANLKKGDILVAPFTDPGWTPLFQSITGLVVEIGGVMTHGSVIAREYGIPAVVGVDNVTKKLKNGQHVRINGTLGYIEILD